MKRSSLLLHALSLNDRVLEPLLDYAVVASAAPLQTDDINRITGNEVSLMQIYDGSFCLAGNTEAFPVATGRFVVSPIEVGVSGLKVHHALYSLRNLMALMACAMLIYDQLTVQREANASNRQLTDLMRQAELAEPEQMDALIRLNARIAFDLVADEMRLGDIENRVRELRRLFDTILHELGAGELKGQQSLTARLMMPFELTNDLRMERNRKSASLEKQTRILQQFIDSRMIAFTACSGSIEKGRIGRS